MTGEPGDWGAIRTGDPGEPNPGGQPKAHAPPAILRELHGLNEQLAQVLTALSPDWVEFHPQDPSGEPSFMFAGQPAANVPLKREARPPLPDPRLIRRIIRQRRSREQFFGQALFADPAWDMLLDLTAARAEHLRVSVTSLCIASGVPTTTALRWINQLFEVGLLQRVEDPDDRRRTFIVLSDRAADCMARYFHSLGRYATSFV